MRSKIYPHINYHYGTARSQRRDNIIGGTFAFAFFVFCFILANC